MRRYLDSECEPIAPQLSHETLEDHVLSLVASRFCRTDAEVCSLLEETLTAQWVWRETLTLDENAFRFRAATNRVVDAGALTRNPDRGILEPTPFGLAVAAKGIALATARDLEKWIRESETRVWTNLDLILAAAASYDGRMPALSLTAQEYERAGYVDALRKAAESPGHQADVPLTRFRNLLPFFEEMRAIKAALVLNEWIEHVPTRELEERYQTMAGQILADRRPDRLDCRRDGRHCRRRR